MLSLTSYLKPYLGVWWEGLMGEVGLSGFSDGLAKGILKYRCWWSFVLALLFLSDGSINKVGIKVDKNNV